MDPMASCLAPIPDNEFVPRVRHDIFTYRVVSEATPNRHAFCRCLPNRLTLSMGFGWYNSEFVREMPEEVVRMAVRMQGEILVLDEESLGWPEDDELPVDVVYVFRQDHQFG